MITRPVFKAYYHVEVLDSEGVFLLSETTQTLLRGALYCKLAPLLDGQRTADELVDALEDEATPAEVYYALTRLEQQGYLAEANGALPPDRAAFWSALGADATLAEERLATTPLSLVTFGALDRAAYAEALVALGLRVRQAEEPGGSPWPALQSGMPDAPPADLLIALTDDYLQEGLADFNAAALGAASPWLLAKPVGKVVWMGPLFRPGVTGCWECLAHRLRANREVERFLQTRRLAATPLFASSAALPATRQVALGLIATEAARWIGAQNAPIEGAVLTLDLATWEMERHTLVQRPQCLRCGDGGAPRSPGPLVLESRTKRFTDGGGHRAAPPEATIERFGHHVSPITGVVSVLQRSSDRDSPVHTYVAGHNWGLNADNLHQLRRSIRNKSGGKGMSDAQAKASGLCEAIERHSGRFHRDEARRRASLRELGDAAIHPNACALFSKQQYRDRQTWNERQSAFQRVPRPFDRAEEVDWTPLWSLTRRELRYLPTAYCYFGYPGASGTEFCWADSNGNAAGNSLEEAVLQGLLELVERDSVALWWYNRLRRPAVDLGSFAEPYIGELREHYRALGRELWVLDITSDLAIPSFAALSRRTDAAPEAITLGFGAHLDPRVGLLRALTEVNQSIAALYAVDGVPGGMGMVDDRDTIDWLRTATLATQSYLAPAADRSAVRCADFVYAPRDDLLEDILAVQRTIEELGMEVLLLDQTRPDVGLPVVKVVVPGLRHFWARFAPGRLYDVPVKMGWLRGPLAEEQLNPVPMFL